jgi:RNA polymerase sigma factor (sigma-70 family)
MIKPSYVVENKKYKDAARHYFASGSIDLLYELCAKSWYYFALNITKNKVVAEDCVADFCEKLLCFSDEKRAQIIKDVVDYEEAVLYCILRNICYDLLRKQKRRLNILQSLFYKEATIEESELNKNDLIIICNQLTPRQREILLHHLNGYSNDEISNMLNISYHSVKNTLSDARTKFKYWYEKL